MREHKFSYNPNLNCNSNMRAAYQSTQTFQERQRLAKEKAKQYAELNKQQQPLNPVLQS